MSRQKNGNWFSIVIMPNISKLDMLKDSHSSDVVGQLKQVQCELSLCTKIYAYWRLWYGWVVLRLTMRLIEEVTSQNIPASSISAEYWCESIICNWHQKLLRICKILRLGILVVKTDSEKLDCKNYLLLMVTQTIWQVLQGNSVRWPWIEIWEKSKHLIVLFYN